MSESNSELPFVGDGDEDHNDNSHMYGRYQQSEDERALGSTADDTTGSEYSSEFLRQLAMPITSLEAKMLSMGMSVHGDDPAPIIPTTTAERTRTRNSILEPQDIKRRFCAASYVMQDDDDSGFISRDEDDRRSSVMTLDLKNQQTMYSSFQRDVEDDEEEENKQPRQQQQQPGGTPSHAPPPTLLQRQVAPRVRTRVLEPLERTTQITKSNPSGATDSLSLRPQQELQPGAYRVPGMGAGQRPAWTGRQQRRRSSSRASRRWSIGNRRRSWFGRSGRDMGSQSNIPPELRVIRNNNDEQMEAVVNVMEKQAEKNEDKQEGNNFRVTVVVIVVVVLLIATGIGLGVGLTQKRSSSPSQEQDGDVFNNTGSETSTNITSMTPCQIDSSRLPTIFSSCICLGTLPESAWTITQEQQELRILLVDFFETELYQPANTTLTVSDGCQPHNMALSWLVDDILETNNTNVESWKNRFLLASIISSWVNRENVRLSSDKFRGWLSGESECVWQGIQCNNNNNNTNSTNGGSVQVSALRIEGFDVNSGLVTELFFLSHLEILDLSRSQLGSTIPSEIALLSRLDTLRLDNCGLSGTIPNELYSLANLRTLDIQSNRVEGTLPTLIGSLTNLELYDARRTSMRGTLPTEIGLMTSLTDFNTRSTKFSGGLPSEFGNLSSLLNLDLRNGNLLIEIPTEVGNLRQLTSLNLNFNRWDGTLPSEIGMLHELKGLFLGNIQSVRSLRGSIPTEVGQLTKLTALYAPAQQFMGTFPSELGALGMLILLSLDGAVLTGVLPTEIGQLSALKFFGLGRSRLEGTIPLEFQQNVVPECFLLDDSSEITGMIPPEWCEATNPIICVPKLTCDCCECPSSQCENDMINALIGS